MARPTSPILSADTGRAQAAALVVLVVLAGVQVTLLMRSLWLSTEAELRETEMPVVTAPAVSGAVESPNPSINPPEPGQLATGPAPTAPVNLLAAPDPGQLAGMPGQSDPGTARPNMPSPVQLASPGPSSASEGMNPEVAELLETVKQLRPLGDTAGMLAVLRRCEVLAPEEPEVLSEFALTYEQMGLADRALGYWRRLLILGPARAGQLHAVAAQRLDSAGEKAASTTTEGVTVPPTQPMASVADGQVLEIGRCEIVKDMAVTSGERAILRIPIQRLSEGFIEPTAVSVDVFFFDKVNDLSVEPTRADPPVSSWVAAPVDWEGEGVEPLDVIYSLPAMTAEEVKNHGQRRFHGYLVKLYYQNRLQATVADPSDLLTKDGNGADPLR